MDKPGRNDGPGDEVPNKDQAPEGDEPAEGDQSNADDQPKRIEKTGKFDPPKQHYDRPRWGDDAPQVTPEGMAEPGNIDRRKLTPIQRRFNEAGDQGADEPEDGPYSINWKTGEVADDPAKMPDHLRDKVEATDEPEPDEAVVETDTPEGTDRPAESTPEPGDQPDPEGGWRGESGRWLTPNENADANRNIDRVREVEPRITADLQQVESEVDGAKLVGLEYRLKGEERLKDKIAERLRDNPDETAGEALGRIGDAVRYTYQFDTDDYVRGYNDVCARMEDAGYTMSRSKNTWDSSDYKGINTRWQSPEGQLFELQFHTPESFETKQHTHGFYEQMRDPNTTEEEYAALRSAQSRIVSRVPVPPGVDRI